MGNFEQNAATASIENEIAIFEAFRATAMELGLAQAVIHLTEEVSTRRQSLAKSINKLSAK